MVAALGALAFKMKSLGVAKATQAVGKFQTKVGDMSKQIGPQMEKLTKKMGKFGLIVGGVFTALIASSPLLRARMEILSLRINELTRVFGDALAPAIEFVTDLVEALTDWFFSLDQPVQDAIVFGSTFVIVLGLLALAFAALSVAMSPVTLVILALAAVAAILFLAWETNFLGIRDLVAAVFAAIGAIFDGIGNVIKEWGKAIGRVIDNVIAVFEGIVDFVKAVFSGNLEGAIEAIQKIFETVFKNIVEIIMWPLNALKALIDGITGGQFINDMLSAGKAFLDAFIKGVQRAIDDAVGIVADVLEWFGSFFGGSLPERGPLKHVVTWGQDFGKAYNQGVGKGLLQSNMGEKLRSVSQGFGKGLGEGLGNSDMGEKIQAYTRGIGKGLGEGLGQSNMEKTIQSYTRGVGEGSGEGIVGDTTTRTFNIDTIALSLSDVSDDNIGSFAKKFDEGVRRSTL